jgi:hypothetical protein
LSDKDLISTVILSFLALHIYWIILQGQIF